MFEGNNSTAIIEGDKPPPNSAVRKSIQRLRKSTLFRNFLSVGLATVVSRALGLIVLGYPARTLGPERFGMVGYATSLVAYASILQSPGLILWGTRAVARDASTAGETLFSVNSIRMVLSLLGYVALVLFAFTFVDIHLQSNVILLSGTVLLFTGFSADWALNGIGSVQIPAWIAVVTTAISVCALLLLVHSPSDVLVYCTIAPAAALIASVVGNFALARFRGVSVRAVRPARLVEVARQSAPLSIVMALVVVLHYSNNLIIYARLGAHELGIFLASYRLIELATTVPGLLGIVFFPRLMKTAVSDLTAAKAGARLFAQVHMVAAFFVAAVLFAEAPSIVRILYGVKYQEAVPLLRVMSFSVIFNYAICGYTNCLISFGRDRVMIMVVSVCALVSVGGGLLLVPLLGLWGAALVITSIDCVGWLVSLPAYRTTIGSLQFGVWLWPAVGGLLIASTSIILQKMDLPVWARAPLITMGYVPFVVISIRGVWKR
jgi:O-antigen/teichoic acid export membrane protein